MKDEAKTKEQLVAELRELRQHFAQLEQQRGLCPSLKVDHKITELDESANGQAMDCLAGGGEMGALMRSLDWSATPVGPVSAWPQSLRTAVSICISSLYPIEIWWGPQYIRFYYDADRPILASTKHPQFIGRPGQECWEEIWHVIGPMLDSVRETGIATWSEDFLLTMTRNGYLEETYITFSYAPLRDETGGVGGIFCVCNETTERVLGERRLRTLRDLGARANEAQTVEDACRTAAQIVGSNAHDIPFALLYLLDDSGLEASLVGMAGLQSSAPTCPQIVDLTQENEFGTWPLAQVVCTGQAKLVTDLESRFGKVSAGPWAEPPHSALVLPLVQPGQEQPTGLLVAGISSRRALDDDYRGFLELVTGQIATALASARALEEERKRAEALAELDRAKTVFFSNVSHEFRTPLTLMLGPLEDLMASEDTPLPPPQLEQVQLIHRNGLRLLKLVNTLLDFSRIESGRVQASYEPTDLSGFTAELASVFRSAIERAGLTLVVDCPPLPEPVYVDRDMWEKVVLNLLSNAFKFTFEGEIVVSLSWKERRVELSVRDTGTGIAAKELAHLFERFHRVEGASGRTHEGSGIGLALVQEIVQLHGGTVEVTSEIGIGTTFTVTVPTGSAHLPVERIGTARILASTAMGAAPYVEEALRWLPEKVSVASAPWITEQEVNRDATKGAAVVPARILLADDNADMRDYVSRLLRSRYEVDAVADGAAALVAAYEQAPDLVLSDVMMPGLNGFELLRELRSDPRTREVPIILLSARAGEEARIEGLKAGADDYLVKPFSARELMARVGAALELSQLRQETTRREQKLRAEAESANRLKDEFLATLSHELRSPLNAMLGWTTLLRSRKFDEATVNRALETIERNARTQAQLVEDLLDVSRIIRGQLRLNVRAVELIPVIEAALDVVRPAAEAKDVRLQPVLDPAAGPVSGDSDRLQQIIWNLLTNAVKFTPRGGRVQIRTERINSHVEIIVTDTGQGISAEFLPYVFDRFRQADNSITRSYSGLGLGLAIVRHLVELHGGAVHADSLGEGQGATFTVKLPLMAIATKNSKPERVHPAVGSGIALDYSPRLDSLRILVVDDEADTRELLVCILQECGAAVVAVASADEAISALINQPSASRFDVLVSDIGMPDEDGYALLRRVRMLGSEQGGQIPAVALTAYVRTEDRRAALLAGFQLHLAKPVDPAELIAAITNLAGRTEQG